MKTLNLVDIDKSDIKYQIQKFPDGQQNVVIAPGNHSAFNSNTRHKYKIVEPNPIQIKARLNKFLDLELIICATQSLRAVGVKQIHLYTPYFMGARSDRQFERGGNRYLADVICPIINSLNFESVSVLDPHSYVLGNLINNFELETNVKLARWALVDLYGSFIENSPLPKLDNCILVSPDAGASHKIFKLAEQIGYKGDIITCTKERNKDGKIIGTSVPFKIKDIVDKDFIIVDDICDGGQTFINIAKHFKENYGDLKGKMYLIITHGIFSKGTTELGHYFDAIYTTNSYKSCNQLELMKVKQLNVF
jgi:ribose-phosphate pyrophosphokinase